MDLRTSNLVWFCELGLPEEGDSNGLHQEKTECYSKVTSYFPRSSRTAIIITFLSSPFKADSLLFLFHGSRRQCMHTPFFWMGKGQHQHPFPSTSSPQCAKKMPSLSGWKMLTFSLHQNFSLPPCK